MRPSCGDLLGACIQRAHVQQTGQHVGGGVSGGGAHNHHVDGVFKTYEVLGACASTAHAADTPAACVRLGWCVWGPAKPVRRSCDGLVSVHICMCVCC